MYGEQGEKFVQLLLTDLDLRTMLRCLAEDMIYEKYNLESAEISHILKEIYPPTLMSKARNFFSPIGSPSRALSLSNFLSTIIEAEDDNLLNTSR